MNVLFLPRIHSDGFAREAATAGGGPRDLARTGGVSLIPWRGETLYGNAGLPRSPP